MKSINKIILCLAAFLIALGGCLPVYAQKSYENEPYYFKSYDVNINVLENNTLEITESINACFNEERHGIYRTIPLENRIYRTDGSYNNIKAKIKNIDANENFSWESDSEACTIRIGEENKLITGDHSFKISYSYILGKDINEGFDELYFNIIGDSWDTYIENISFTINMPKEFDASLLGFSTGEYGTAGTEIVKYSVSGNTITGSLSEPLSPHSALTVRLELEDGYFFFNEALYRLELASLIVIPLLALLIVIILWAKFGNDKKVIKPVEFYPPEGMSSADVAYWYKGAIVNTDIVPLLIELANEGHIEINEIVKPGIFKSKSDFEIKKVTRVYYGHDKNKHIFFNGLFKCSGSDTVRKSDLEEAFYKTLEKISSNYNTMENRKKVFSAKSLIMRIVGWTVSILSIVLCILISTNLLMGSARLLPTAIGVLIGFAAAITAFFIRKRTDESHELLQRIEGFRDFLETAEKERLETLVCENPQYFYDILPYAYVLGVSNKWISKFESIAIEPARWYNSPNPFEYYAFSRFLGKTIDSSRAVMTSSPQSSSGSGFSGGGGGFSGGGFGGGGGGSW